MIPWGLTRFFEIRFRASIPSLSILFNTPEFWDLAKKDLVPIRDGLL
jgi:hypothetical protein